MCVRTRSGRARKAGAVRLLRVQFALRNGTDFIVAKNSNRCYSAKLKRQLETTCNVNCHCKTSMRMPITDVFSHLARAWSSTETLLVYLPFGNPLKR